MMFSSHRFGNLTRHADLILYVAIYIDSECARKTDKPYTHAGT